MEGSDRELKVFQIKFPRISLQTGVLILLIKNQFTNGCLDTFNKSYCRKKYILLNIKSSNI